MLSLYQQMYINRIISLAVIRWPVNICGKSPCFSLYLHMCLNVYLESGVKGKKPIQTKYRMPLFNWQALKEEQVAGTVFTELDYDNVLVVREELLLCSVYLRKINVLF